RPRPARGLVPAVSAAAAPLAPSAAGPRGLRRLLGYVRRNRGRYVLGALLTLGYAALFAAVPMLVAWAMRAVEEGRPLAEVAQRCGWLGGVAVARGGLRYLSRTVVFNA